MCLTVSFDIPLYICFMFHWICPECGREIAPTAKECAACEPPSAVATAPAAAPSAAPLESPSPAPVQPSVAGAPKPPAPAAPSPLKAAGRDLSPLGAPPAPAQHPDWKQSLPALEPARAPRVSSAPLREPEPAAPTASPVTQPLASPEITPSRTSLPELSSPAPAAPPLAGLANYAKIAAERIRPAGGSTKPASAAATEQISLPGPTLPHELTSLNAAGIAKIMVPAGRATAARRSSSWAVSMVVAAAVLAASLGAAF